MTLKRALLTVAGAVMLVLLLLPPWRLVWTTAVEGAASVELPSTWAGFHSWAYSATRPTKILAWDGPNGGGKVDVIGTPELAYGLWTGLLLSVSIGTFAIGRLGCSASRSDGQ